jgi:hypothetical protein
MTPTPSGWPASPLTKCFGNAFALARLVPAFLSAFVVVRSIFPQFFCVLIINTVNALSHWSNASVTHNSNPCPRGTKCGVTSQNLQTANGWW